MTPRLLSFDLVFDALAEGWQTAAATRRASLAWAAVPTLIGGVILGVLLGRGWTPFAIAAAGAFMLLGPALLAGFFGIAVAHEAGRAATLRDVLAGYGAASPALWALALVCGLFFMIFVTDAAILYAYMVGDVPVWLDHLLPHAGVGRFVVWSSVSGAVIAFLLYAAVAFAVPLLCERRDGLVQAVVCSVRIVFSRPFVALGWGCLLGLTIIGSVLLLPVLVFSLPWLAFASRALYRRVCPLEPSA